MRSEDSPTTSKDAPFGASYVVGRQVLGGGDQSLPASALAEIAERSAGAGIEAVARGSQYLGRDVGRYLVTRDRRSGQVTDRDIFLDRSLSEAQLPRVAAHEVGHLIDDIVSKIPVANIKTELRAVYNDLNNPSSSGGKPFTPAALGYRGALADRELQGGAQGADG